MGNTASTKGQQPVTHQSLAELEESILELDEEVYLANVSKSSIIGLFGKKTQQKHYLDRLKTRLHHLHWTFIDPAAKTPVIWPRDASFRDLDECIFGLAGTLRKKKRLRWVDAVVLVDKRWPSLHLKHSVRSLIKQGLARKPKLPTKPEGVEHFDWISRLAERSGRRATLARRFIKDHELLLVGKINLSKVRWEDYEEILLKKDQRIFLRLDMELPNQRINCYVRYLEMQRDHWLWSKDMDQWSAENAKRKPYFEWGKRNEIRDSGLGGTRINERRRLATERQRRRREKKSAQKSVTES
jgi:hypothetical protein